jgi:hypothetical protein
LSPHLELKTGLDILLQRLGDGLIKVAQNLHGKLRVDALITDEIIEGIRQSETDTVVNHVSLAVAKQRIAMRRSTCFGGTARKMIVLR